MVNLRMIKILILCLTVLICFVGTVNAEQVTMEVDSKHIMGIGTGNTPLDVDNFCNVVYVISDLNNSSYDTYVIEEYPISLEDYCKVKKGDIVTLESPVARTSYWKIINIT